MTKDKQTNTAQTNHALPQGWREVRLGEIVEQIIDNRGKNPERYCSYGIPVIDNFLIKGERKINLGKVRRFIDEETYKEFIRKYGKKGDILITLVGNGYGSVSMHPNKKSVIIQNTIGLRIDENIAHNYFIFYALKNNKDNIIKLDRGAAQPSIKVSDLLQLNILLPLPPTQKAIAKVLSAFDDKIELLREQNETLEQIGQTLFKEWFGKYSPSRPDDLPEGWRVGKLGEVIETFLGGTPSRSKKEYWTNGTIPWINSGKVNDFRITEGSEMITQEAVENSSTKLLPNGTVVLAITGATLGQYSRLEIDACFNQSVVGLKENEKFKSSYIYFWVANNISHIIKHASGGAHQHINKENINQTDFIIPTEEYLNEYYKMADVIMEKISNNVFQIQTLTQTRDTLLPKLMKGEVLV